MTSPATQWSLNRLSEPASKLLQRGVLPLAALACVALMLPVVVAQSNLEPKMMTSDIADDEVVQFFRTAAAYEAATDSWRIPIHGWVYEPQKSRFRKAVFAMVLNAKYNLKLSSDAQPYYDRRLNLLIADNERGKRPSIVIGDEQLIPPPSGSNGQFKFEVTLPNTVVQHYRQGDILPFSSYSRNNRVFHGQVALIKESGLSVISDIDDTVKVSEVLDHQRLIDNTFLKEFTAVPGMSAAYQQLAERVEGFHFVSSSPWQLYAPLQEFCEKASFPWATFSLKAIRFRDMTLFDLFKPGTATKPMQIEALLARFPQHRFILIGDSGEQDPEVYAGIMEAYRERIERIFIRNITDESLDNSRFSRLVNDPDRWVLFSDPRDIRL